MTKWFVLGFVIMGIMMGLALDGFAEEKTYSGRVIDAETREPIEGAVVVIHWNEATRTLIGDWSARLKDVKETLTDKDGQWAIKGPAGGENSLSYFLALIPGLYYTRQPEFVIFKPGYCSWPAGLSIEACKGRMKGTGPGKLMEGQTLELPRLTSREFRLMALTVGPIFSTSDDPETKKKILKKQLEFLRLIDEERISLGLSEYGYYKELRNEK
jgi:hypothetical protein